MSFSVLECSFPVLECLFPFLEHPFPFWDKFGWTGCVSIGYFEPLPLPLHTRYLASPTRISYLINLKSGNEKKEAQVASMMIYYVLTRKRIVTAFESITTENESQKQLRILWLAWHGAGFFLSYVCM